MHQAVFHISGEGPYERATAASTTRIELWCNDHCDLLHVVGDEDDLVVDHIREEVGVRQRVTDGDDRLLVTESCLKQHGDDYVEQYLALDAQNLTNFYRDITTDHTVTVESKRELSGIRADVPLPSLDALLPTLSNRQREVFRTAYRAGYYELPRETTTAEIAEAVGVKRRTAEHHLRRAEKKLADSLIEYL